MTRSANINDSGGTPTSSMRELFASLDARKRPEDVAQTVLEVLGQRLAGRDRGILDLAARQSCKRTLLGFTSMLEDFARPVGLEKQVRTAEVLFASAYRLSAAECTKPDVIETFVRAISNDIKKCFGASDFMHDRMNRADRRARGMDISRRRYNKLFRILARMERKLATLVRELRKREFTQIGKSSLANRITWSEFAADSASACFIAYYTSRCNLRSEFTISGQVTAFDDIAEMLLSRCDTETANWWAIAHVYPERRVLARLSDEQKGQMLGIWFNVLGEIAEFLHEVWEGSNIQRDTMIVQRGNDSSTWNSTAGAWNKARSGWISVLDAMSMTSVLDAVCPGKVLRLMAADVAAWHRRSGGGLDPDTAVWNNIPLPWQVLRGNARCGREYVAAVCRKHGVNGEQRGWIAPRPTARAVRFQATPELVHGVTVSSPGLAMTLRTAGWFSGKTARTVTASVAVDRDEHGFAIGASPTTPGTLSSVVTTTS